MSIYKQYKNLVEIEFTRCASLTLTTSAAGAIRLDEEEEALLIFYLVVTYNPH